MKHWLILMFLSCHFSQALSYVRVKRGTGGGISFPEGEEGQASVVTSNGVPATLHEEKQDKIANQEYSAKDIAMIQAEEEEETDAGEIISKRGKALRTRRAMDKWDRQRWPKAIVPFKFSNNSTLMTEKRKNEVLAAQTRWHKYTCVRFVPWVRGETRETYGLPDEGHVKFSKGDGCSAVQGNAHSATGQGNNCCDRGTCTHELGHSLGLWHEHQNPLRHDFTRLEWGNVRSDFVWTYKAIRSFQLFAPQYDVTSNMHYPGHAFHILYEELRPLLNMQNQFYMYKDVSVAHDCKALHCSDFSVQCHNDGFVTLVDDQCSCLCPPGLDPDTGCTTTVKSVPPSPAWPAGEYAMLSPKEGCPRSAMFQTGAWKHWSEGRSKQSNNIHLGGTFTPESFEYHFCVKSAATDTNDGPAWEAGQYCVLRAGGQCPQGFQTGSIQWDDQPDKRGSGSGHLPDGVFGNDTRLQFCCRDDGFVSTPLAALPTSQPLVLLPDSRESKGKCQEVSGMRWTKQYMEFDSYPELRATQGEIPYRPAKPSLKINFCYYEPANFNCGGEIILSANNREAVITSPNFPAPYDTNMECTWLIKTEANDSRVLLNFDEFELTSVGDTCQDSLEIRYNLPGQPGIRYCGDGLSRTIRSLNDIVLLTLRSDQHQVDSDYGFRLTASLHQPEEDECYAPATKGTLYRGEQNYTRGMKACRPWSKLTHCNHHAFSLRDFGKGLDGSYCRNPDNTAQPWCYTEAEGCKRDYCDVCNIERVYDRKPAKCHTPTVCSQSRWHIIEAGCAATCNLQPPDAPIRGQTCGPPEFLPDAELREPLKESYTVGENVTYTCTTGADNATSTCLSQGQWSPIAYVCGACSPGWAFNRGSCYKLFEGRIVNFNFAKRTCSQHGAQVTSVKDQEEQDLVSNLRDLQDTMWIGATDEVTEGTFLWQDGTPVEFFNWKGQPRNSQYQDCVLMDPKYSSGWKINNCQTEKSPMFVCKYSLSNRTLCRDRLEDCRSRLETAPDTCYLQPVFAQHECPYSCGICLPDSTAECSTSPPSSGLDLVRPAGQISIPRGATLTFNCSQGHLLAQGQLTLACGNDEHLIGHLPVCIDNSNSVTDSNDVAIVARANRLPLGDPYVFLGMGNKLTVQWTGVIKTWKFYSRQSGWTIFQVWRPQSGERSFLLVGQTQVMTQGVGEESHDVPEEDWIPVQPGDRLALWQAAGASTNSDVPYDQCTGGETKKDFAVLRSQPAYRGGDFSMQLATRFPTTATKCWKISFKAVIYPLEAAPENRKMATNHVSLLSRKKLGAKMRLYLSDNANLRIPVDGEVSEWQAFIKSRGKGALQVWRPRPDLGDDSFEFVGQTLFDITTPGEYYNNTTLLAGERIAVKEGDVTGVWYAYKRLGISFDICQTNGYPEGGRMRKSVTILTATSFTVGAVISAPLINDCYTISFRAIVSTT